MSAFILTMVVYLSTTPQNAGMATISVEYKSEETCMKALNHNRDRLQKAQVLLATCTPK
jgi:hypothetical protein